MFGLTESNDKAKLNLTLVVEEIISGKTLFYFWFYDLVKSCCREKELEEKELQVILYLFGTAN
jgi:hypothetical protein